MKKQNNMLIDVIYDSIDLFLELKDKGFVFGTHINNTDKAIICLYLSLISNDPVIKKVMCNFKYRYKIYNNIIRNNLKSEDYNLYFRKYFSEFLDSNEIKKETTSNELMFILLNTGIVETLNIQYKFNHEMLKKHFMKRDKYDKVLVRKINKSK